LRLERRCAIDRSPRPEHDADAFCFAPEHAAKRIEMPGRHHQLEFRGNPGLAFDLERGAGR
jgi:hypothetical protein